MESVFQRNRDRFGAKREEGARKIEGLASEVVYNLRGLKKQVFG